MAYGGHNQNVNVFYMVLPFINLPRMVDYGLHLMAGCFVKTGHVTLVHLFIPNTNSLYALKTAYDFLLAKANHSCPI